jgi:hypothetical protein
MHLLSLPKRNIHLVFVRQDLSHNQGVQRNLVYDKVIAIVSKDLFFEDCVSWEYQNLK